MLGSTEGLSGRCRSKDPVLIFPPSSIIDSLTPRRRAALEFPTSSDSNIACLLNDAVYHAPLHFKWTGTMTLVAKPTSMTARAGKPENLRRRNGSSAIDNFSTNGTQDLSRRVRFRTPKGLQCFCAFVAFNNHESRAG